MTSTEPKKEWAESEKIYDSFGNWIGVREVRLFSVSEVKKRWPDALIRSSREAAPVEKN